MGRDQLLALARIIEEQIAAEGTASPVVGSWSIRFDGERNVFYFEKCEFGDYCEERPAVISSAGEVLDRGGPILVEQ